MNILQVRKYNLLIKEELQSKLGSHILYQEKLFKNKQKQLKNKEKKIGGSFKRFNRRTRIN